jgi:hypothetical protein
MPFPLAALQITKKSPNGIVRAFCLPIKGKNASYTVKVISRLPRFQTAPLFPLPSGRL